MKKEDIKRIYKSITSIFSLSIVIIAVAFYFATNNALIGPSFILVGFFGIALIKIFKIKIRHIYPDLVFGFVDNFLMVISAIIGGKFIGVSGAVIGGVAGNSVADGISGFFEGYVSEKITKGKYESKRTTLSSSLSKMTGCIFGAGFVLTIVWLVGLIF